MTKYDQAEKNARELLSTVFEGVEPNRDEKFKGDIYTESGSVTIDGEPSNIEVKFISSPGPSMELNPCDDKLITIEAIYNEKDGLVNSINVHRNNIHDGKENDILSKINTGLRDTAIDEINRLNNSYENKETASLELNITQKDKIELLNLLYDRKEFNEKIFCCVNREGMMSIIPRGKVEDYYELIPKLEIRKGDNNLKSGETSAFKDSILNAISKTPEGKDINIVETSIEKYGKSNSPRLCIYTDQEIDKNLLKNFTFDLNDEVLGITPPNGYDRLEKNGKTLYRYKVIKKSGLFRFKFMLGIIKKKDISKEIKNIFDKGISEHSISPNIKITEKIENIEHKKELEIKSPRKDKEGNIEEINWKKLSLFDENFNDKIENLKYIYGVHEKLEENSVNSSLKNTNKASNKLNEAYNNEDNKYEQFINDIYDLRQNSLSNEGEYGMGNLIFKKFRDLGYLDNLKELSRSYKVTELSEDKKED